MADNVPITAGSGTSIAADDISSVWYQRVKITQGADGTADGDVSTALPLPVRGYAGTGAASNVSSSASDVTILAANTSRKGFTVYNDSTQILYLLLATGTSSATNYHVKIASGGFYEGPPWNYVGIVKGIWASANGTARVGEFT